MACFVHSAGGPGGAGGSGRAAAAGRPGRVRPPDTAAGDRCGAYRRTPQTTARSISLSVAPPPHSRLQWPTVCSRAHSIHVFACVCVCVCVCVCASEAIDLTECCTAEGPVTDPGQTPIWEAAA